MIERKEEKGGEKRKLFLFRSSYHAVPRNFEYLFCYREFNGIPQNSYGYAGFLQNISNRFAADFTKLNSEGIKASSFAPKTFLKSGKTFSKALRTQDSGVSALTQSQLISNMK